MRTFPVCILVALAALGCGLCAADAGSGEEEEANAGNVTVTMAINAPLSEVSPYLITFDMAKLTALPQIAPLLTLVETTGTTVGSTRLINGAGPLVGVTVKEELVAFTSNTVTYKILEASGPTSIVNASNYVATVTATASDDGTTTTIDWESTFDAAADVNMNGLKADLAGFYALFISAVAAKLDPAPVDDAYGSGSGSGDDYDCPELGEIWDGANCTFEVFCNLTTHFQMYGNVEQDRVCVLLEACTFETQFASKEPTRTTPRECSPVTQCDNKTQFESKAPTETSDRVCADAQKCDTKTQWVSVKMGKFNDAECSQVSPACNQAYGYELVPATETQDRECKAWKQCNSLYADSPQYMMRDGIVTDNVADFRDRACKSVTTCKLNQYELNRPTNQTDRKCKDRTVCDRETTYISRDATSFSDTVCTLMDELPEVTELVLTLQMEITLNPRTIPPGKEDAVALEIVEGLTKYLVEETGLDKTIIKKMWLFFFGRKSQNPFPGDLFAEVIGIQKKPKVKKNKKNKKAGRPSSGPAGSAGPAAGPGPGRRATGDGWTIEVGMVDSDSSTVQKLAIAQTALDEAIQGKTGPAFALKTIEGVSVSIDATAVTERCTANCASLGRSTNAGNSTGTGTAPLGPYDKFVIPLVVCIILVFVVVLIVVYFKQNKEDNKVLPTHATGGEARGAETPDGPTPDGPTPALESDEADNKAHTAAQMMDKAAPIKVAHERVGSIAALGVSSRGMCSICGKEVLISDHRDKNADGTYRHQACGKKSTESPV